MVLCDKCSIFMICFVDFPSRIKFATCTSDGVIFEKTSNGKIQFLENLNLNGVYGIENTVKIENGIVAIDSDEYPQLNKPARITLRNLNYNSVPIIYYNEGFTLTNINQECDFCEIISYTENPTTDGVVVFEVDHFTSFLLITS